MKYLNPKRYYRRAAKIVYETILHDAREIELAEHAKFDALGLDAKAALGRLNEILREVNGRGFDFQNDSIHWLLFAALSLKLPGVKRILELGTFDGEFTHILARLFPSAEIVTIDLPEGDPLLRDLYDRKDDADYLAYKKKRADRLQRPNVKTIEVNSFFLLDRIQGSFDLIWVDAGHLYPEVAWDTANAYHLCKPGGWMLCDDIIPSKKFYKDAYVSTEAWEVLQYLAERTPVLMTLFLKRRLPELYRKWQTRKYVAAVNKLA